MARKSFAHPPASAHPSATARLHAYDAITLAVNQADSLTGLLAARLSAFDEEEEPAANELYALSLLADTVSEKLQIILDNARALQAAGGAR